MRADWAVVVAAWALLLAATTLLTAGTLYADAVALGGLRTSVRTAAPAQRSARVTYTARIADAPSIDSTIKSELDRLVAAGGGGDVWRFGASGPLGLASDDPAVTKRTTTLAARPSIEAHATLASGRWANAGAQPREATLSVGAATAIGAKAGDRIQLVNRVSSATAIDVLLTGTWTADPEDPYWLGSPQDLNGTTKEGSFTTVGPFVVPVDDLFAGEAGALIAFDWRAIPDLDRLTTDSIGPLGDAAAALPARIHGDLPAGLNPQIETDLPATLTATARSALVSRSGIIVLILEFGVVAAYAIVLVAGLLGDRRRTETALIRSRGGSAGSVIGMATLEAVLLAGTAAIVAPLLSVAVVRLLGSSGPLAELGVGSSVQLSPGAIVADVVGAGAGVVAMTFPAMVGSANLAGIRAAISRPVGRTLGQRLGLDLALVVLAGIALWQLRLYGAPLTKNARGVLGVDPLLVAAPAIGLIAGALLATRLVPRLAEIAEPFLVRGRGLVGSLGGRAIARRPLRYTRSALLLMLAAALGTFSIAHVATWTRSQADQAAYQAGADIRVVGTRSAAVDSLALGPAYREIAGNGGVMAVDRLTVDSGRSVRGAPLLALDGSLGAAIVAAPTAADGAAYASLLPQLGTGRSSVGTAIPASVRRLAFVVDPILKAQVFEGDPIKPDLATDQGIAIAVILQDGDGRLHRSLFRDGFLAGHDQRLTLDLPAGGPFQLIAVELTVSPAAFYGVTGTVELKSLEASDAETGETWATVPGFPAAGATWTWPHDEQIATYHPPADHPGLVTYGVEQGQVDTPFGSGGQISIRLAVAPRVAPLPAIVDARFLELTSSATGDVLPALIQGSAVKIRIIGSVAEFPTLDPSLPFAIVDGPTLALARYAATATTVDAGEWWLATGDPKAAAVAIAAGPDPNATIISRAALESSLLGDPSALGVIGLLGLGSIAAMIFAAIGFVVSAAISTSERAGELALLRALGLSTGQVSRWLSFEHAALLVVGIGAGIGLGALLAWLVLPFATLTRTGAPAIPMPAVILPLEGLLPIVAVAVGILVLTTAALRSQLGGVRLGDVLRARAE
jgi:hypothetical protein